MRRFYLEEKAITGDRVEIDGDQFFHLNKVLRINAGDEVVVVVGDGKDYICEIEKTTKNTASARIKKIIEINRDAEKNITVFQGVPKGEKLELIIQKLTELGVKKLIPLETKYCQKKWENNKLDRYKKISIEATKQCQRNTPMEIIDAINVDKLITLFNQYDLIIFANETEKNFNLNNIISDQKNIAIIIGSEGGFSEEEIEKIINNGAKSITLGKRILRTETAAIALSSVVSFLMGEWK